MSIQAEWIAVDWGTSHLRAWAMQGRKTLSGARSEAGMAGLSRAQFEPALRELVGDWLGAAPLDVVACGMVGARQGWVEAPYTAVPARPLSYAPVLVPDTGPDLRVHVVGGLKQGRPADVMRGEETQIAGFLALNPNWDGVICLPGTHSKWVQVSADEVVSFQSVMTGELFGLLAEQSVLRHSLSDGWDDTVFSEAVSDALSRPEALAAQLFNLRARDLLEGLAEGQGRARLSGLLIGAELAATKPYWLGQQVAIIGAPELNARYAAALEGQGMSVLRARDDAAVLAGLSAARALIMEVA